MSYFFDTYALVEIIKINENYDPYREYPIITTTLNLSEFYFYLLLNFNEKDANEALGKFVFSFVDVNENIAKEAAKFRKDNYKRKLSYVDCIGYVLSRNLGFKFLTGEDFFKEMDNVELVK
ncbi:PIN domain-containing protein [Candidatus Pacearchaeota archaeon]|nr:PIN domain-containing protein [Candidatus Pacearchaeota archaeon]